MSMAGNLRVETCVCRGQIVVRADASEAVIAYAVRQHNETEGHRIWQATRDEPETLEAAA